MTAEFARDAAATAAVFGFFASGRLGWGAGGSTKGMADIVGVEFSVAGLGAGVLVARRRTGFVPAWIALVVGVHLFHWHGCCGTHCSVVAVAD